MIGCKRDRPRNSIDDFVQQLCIDLFDETWKNEWCHFLAPFCLLMHITH